MRLHCAFLALSVFVFIESVTLAQDSDVQLPKSLRGAMDLHVHLAMEQAVPRWIFRGEFLEPLKSSGWNDLIGSNANAESLEKSGADLVVVALYAHVLKGRPLRESLRAQIAAIRNWVDQQSRQDRSWMIARSAKEAIAAFKKGHRVLIFSLEGGSGLLETEEDLKEFIDDAGISIVTLLHLTDDDWGGAAILAGFQGFFANPFAWIESRWTHQLNPRGLTSKGRIRAMLLIRRGVWIDLSHASDRSLMDLRPMLKTANQPALFTHTSLRKYHVAERGVSETHLEWVKYDSGIVGLMPSERMMKSTPGYCHPVQQRGGLGQWVTQYNQTVDLAGPNAVSIGSDFNAPIDHLSPGCGSQTSIDGEKGYWSLDQCSDLWIAMKKQGARVPDPQQRILQQFLNAWSKVR